MSPFKVALAIGLIASMTQASPTSGHDKPFWKAIAASQFAVPAGQALPALVAELSGYLASSDPELRDDIAYSTLTNWIYRQRLVPVEMRRGLLSQWTANLKKSVGERGTDTIFGRSFSALSLGTLVVLDNEAPYFEKPEFDALLLAAVDYLHAERDVRGFDPAKGWMHSVAHTADLLKFLSRSRHLVRAQQGVVLLAIAEKMQAVDEVLTHGEDERLARAVLSLAARPDFDEAGFKAFTALLAPARSASAPTPASLASNQNRKNLLVALYAVLSVDARPLPTIQAAREIVLATLKSIM